jgi:hypothetical protein
VIDNRLGPKLADDEIGEDGGEGEVECLDRFSKRGVTFDGPGAAGRDLIDLDCELAGYAVGAEKGLNEVEAKVWFGLPTLANGDRGDGKGEPKPKPKVEGRVADGNWSAEGGC